MAPTRTIILTGGNGSLGSKIACCLAKDYPGLYHIVLTARNITSESARQASDELRLHTFAFSWETLDLASFQSVNNLTATIKEKIAKRALPKLYGIINSAGISTNQTKRITGDGFDLTYQTNVLSPMLLISNLLDILSPKGIIVNVASAAHSLGEIDYFRNLNEENGPDKLSLKGGLTKYGSSKLLIIMAGYVLHRKLEGKVQIAALDPGGMSGGSRLSSDMHWFLSASRTLLTGLRPLVRLAMKSAINPPEVPAQAISDLFKNNANVDGKYFILDDESKPSPLCLDKAKQDEVWGYLLEDFKGKNIALKF
ncbi:hypothetical protein B7463_g87, partial [Scytalidium lignicola]